MVASEVAVVAGIAEAEAAFGGGEEDGDGGGEGWVGLSAAAALQQMGRGPVDYGELGGEEEDEEGNVRGYRQVGMNIRGNLMVRDSTIGVTCSNGDRTCL